jgi:hypothetical protein
MYAVLSTAITQNKVDFVEFLGYINLSEFLTKERLVELYNKVPENHPLYNVLQAMRKTVGLLVSRTTSTGTRQSTDTIMRVHAGIDTLACPCIYNMFRCN